VPQGARHGLQGKGGGWYFTDQSLWLSVDLIRNLERTAKMGKDAAEIKKEFHSPLGKFAREL
jgi:hypothetical protein